MDWRKEDSALLNYFVKSPTHGLINNFTLGIFIPEYKEVQMANKINTFFVRSTDLKMSSQK